MQSDIVTFPVQTLSRSKYRAHLRTVDCPVPPGHRPPLLQRVRLGTIAVRRPDSDVPTGSNAERD